MLAVLNSDEFVDKPPLQVYAILLERGQYLASVSPMYRVLYDNRQVKERRRQASHPPRKVPELIATRPGQVYSWDITKLPGPTRSVYYDAYVMIDIFSRYIVGAIVHSCEDGLLAKQMMLDAFGLHGTPQVVHSDGGPSMTSKTVKTLLADLDVVRSRPRPHVSNDNPYSEALFNTMKSCQCSPTSSSASRTRGSSWTSSCTPTTITTATPGSACTPQQTSITAWTITLTATATPPWQPHAALTRNGSAPARRPDPRSSTETRPSGSTHPTATA